jgi:hypothetical protein
MIYGNLSELSIGIIGCECGLGDWELAGMVKGSNLSTEASLIDGRVFNHGGKEYALRVALQGWCRDQTVWSLWRSGRE